MRFSSRFALVLIAIFGAIAVLLTAVRLYGVLSDAVGSGLRMALGAALASIFHTWSDRVSRLSAMGVAAGIAAAFYLTMAMTRMLIGVRPHDFATFATIAVLFSAIAAVACCCPRGALPGSIPQRLCGRNRVFDRPFHAGCN